MMAVALKDMRRQWGWRGTSDSTGLENSQGPDAKESPEIVETTSDGRVKYFTTVMGKMEVACDVGGKQ